MTRGMVEMGAGGCDWTGGVRWGPARDVSCSASWNFGCFSADVSALDS